MEMGVVVYRIGPDPSPAVGFEALSKSSAFAGQMTRQNGSVE
jgi:hypothetical protein